LARTPRGEKSLIRISYAYMYSLLSPLYKKHATEVSVEFATLGLNFDVRTIMHLRPFMETLLARRAPPPSQVPQDEPLSPQSPDQLTQKSQSTNSLASLALGLEEYEDKAALGEGEGEGSGGVSGKESGNGAGSGGEMMGMHIDITVRNISLDLLRTPVSDTEGAVLASAFSLQITDLRADIDILEFLKAGVRLRSFEIIDARAVSTDYVFKKVFCPVVDMDASVAKWSKSVSGVRSTEGSSKKSDSARSLTGGKGQEGEDSDRPPDLLHVQYTQISTDISAVDVTVLNITSFVAIDTILDLSYVATENAFAILDLIAAPPLLPYEPESSSTVPLPTDGVGEADSAHPTDEWTNEVIPKAEGGKERARDNEESHEEARESEEGDADTMKLRKPNLLTSPSTSAKSNPRTPARRSSLSPAGATYDFEMCSPKKPPLPPIKMQPDGSSTTMNVIVKVTNPRLILLEDPTTDESRAIVGSCDLEVHYSRENRLFAGVSSITKAQNRELRESLHVSVHNHEVFVLRSMLLWHPQPIVEPMGLELHLRRRTLNSVLVSSIMSVDVDSVNARVSINDIVLAQNILTRRSLTEAPPAPIPAPVPASGSGSGANSRMRKQSTASEIVPDNNNLSPMRAQEGPNPSYTISLNMGSLSLVGINDYNGQNVPVIRALLDGTTFYAEGSQYKTQGEGSLIASTDFYNPRLSVWEPMMDRWHPSLSYTSWTVGSSIELRSDHTMQLTVSGTMLEVLLQTYSLFFRMDDVAERDEVPDVLISNFLGSDTGLEIFDSSTGVAIMTLMGLESKPLPRVAGGGSRRRSVYSLRNTPGVVDIHFTGVFGEQRLPLHHLPLNVSKPRAYNLQPRPVQGPEDSQNAGSSSAHSQPVVLEPIVEEVFESSRYDPLTGRYGIILLKNNLVKTIFNSVRF
jgi:hypothetical protein